MRPRAHTLTGLPPLLTAPLPPPAPRSPFVSGEYAVNFIQGFEHAKETTYPLQASACCKHFVCVPR